MTGTHDIEGTQSGMSLGGGCMHDSLSSQPLCFCDTLHRVVSYAVLQTEHVDRMIFGNSALLTLTSACFASKN